MAKPSTETTFDSRRVSRRHFLGAAAGGAAGLTGILAAGRAPATAQAKELTFLTVASFVPATDTELKRQLDEWGAKNNVKVRLDIIAHLQLVTKK
jgi:ABC-type glycerol-3-phosphate transport system substrate-binding protein